MKNDADGTHIGKKLKNYRLGQLWTIRELSEHTRIPESTLCQIETGAHNPTDLTLAKLKRAIPELFNGEGELSLRD